MKLNIRAFAGAAGAVSGLAFTICAFFVAVAPGATAAFIGYLLHVDLTGLVRPIGWASLFGGLVATGAAAAISAGLVAWLYNRLI